MFGMILAGGGGTRLWPYSRSMSPKQFLNLGSTPESLLQETYKRLAAIVPNEKVYIIGSKNHKFELAYQIEKIAPDIPAENLLFEPQGRNTAPAILWGILSVPEESWDEPLIILPADHLIPNNELFLKYLNEGATLAREGWVVTFGIKPERPETGYGYIKSGKPLSIGYQVEKFIEKPDKSTAEQYISTSQYTWNSGIFISTPRILIEEYQNQAPKIYNTFMRHKTSIHDLEDAEVVKMIYNEVESDSFDYAILEHSTRVAVLPVDFPWSDLGSWESIHQVSLKDEANNVTRGNVILQDTHNSLIFTTKKLVTSIGVENLIIVETDDALLVCDLNRTQDVKKLVGTLKEEDRYEYKYHKTILSDWGHTTNICNLPGYKINTVDIQPGKYISLQRHQHRSEHWVIVKGTAEVTRGEECFFLTENESTFIPKTVVHRLKNSGYIPLQIIEIQIGDYLEDDDIERFNNPASTMVK
ncbi:MAG: mannose-1-phosphate guanylyltransferase/mannose-6-phosphate isomerase [SAR324 cluster bacterium]|nr:mannose-1-phosphate guanylyltransferase/mannose-6-phosphate isomerase [SAR324 cluster bacterium]